MKYSELDQATKNRKCAEARKWYSKNKSRSAAKKKIWNSENRNKVIEYKRKYLSKNRERINKGYRDRRKANREEYNKAARAKYKNNVEHYRNYKRKVSTVPEKRFIAGKSKNKRIGRKFDLTLKKYLEIISKNCHYCSADLMGSKGLSLDRIDNSKGYTLDNVIPCCGPCNYTRQDIWTVEETEVMIKAVMEFRAKSKTV